MLQVVREAGLRCRTPDGVELVADAWHPAGDGRWPVLLQRLPYGRSVASTTVLPHPAWLARHGYAVVVQDARGRGDSTGTFEPFVNEAADGVASVAWAARLPFASGEVVLYGYSYQGWSQLATAAAQPPELRAIAPMMCGAEAYEGWTYEGGCLRWPFVLFWSAQLRAQESGRFVAGDESALPISRAFGDDPPRWFAEWLSHPAQDDYWTARAVDLGAISVPALCVLGYFDDFAAATASMISALGAEAICGPWEHMPWGTRVGGVELGEDAAPRPVAPALVRFFDRVFKGEDAPAEKILYYSVGGGWRHAGTWPPPHSLLPLNAASGGNANSRHGDGRLDPAEPERPLGDVLVAEPLVPYPGGATYLVDEAAAEDRRDVLCYTTSPLDRELAIAGASTVSVVTSCDRGSHDVVASLVVVSRDGTPRAIARGARRSHAALLDREHRFDISLQPVAWTAQPGERLRLDISGARFPAYDRNLHSEVRDNAHAGADAQRVATITVARASIVLPIERADGAGA